MTKGQARNMKNQSFTHRLARPARSWADGHILGNGDVAAVVWGSPEAVHVGLSKHDVNDLRTSGEHGIRWELTYPEILKRYQKGERDFLMKIGNPDEAISERPVPVSCGRLSLEIMRGIQAADYVQELSLAEAESRCRWVPTDVATWGPMDALAIEARAIVLAEYNAVLVELVSSRPWRVGWSYDRNPTAWLPAPTFEVRKAGGRTCAVMEHRLFENIFYAAAVSARARGFEAGASPHGLRGTVEFGGEKGKAIMVLALASGRDARCESPSDLAAQMAAKLENDDLQRLRREHRRWWKDFWSKSEVQYEDPKVEQLWTMGLYALGCSTRPDKSPPHLQGIWNQHDAPAWHGDFHFNVNVEESHWGACSSNHPELQEAFVRVLIHDWREELRRFAREQYGAPGLAVPFCADWLGRAIHGWPLAAECCNTAWAAQHVWWQWLYIGDVDRLRTEFYPFLRECCEFYLYIMALGEDGLYHFELSHSPEQECKDSSDQRIIVMGRDPAIDLAFVRYLFSAVIEAAGLLNLDDPLTERCRDVLEHLPPLPTLDGFLIDQATGFFGADGERAGFFPKCHRHPSRLAAVFPCGQIGLSSDPETLRLGRRSFAEFRSYGNDNFTGWSEAFQACIAARLGLAEEAEGCLKRLVDFYSFAGLLLSHDSFSENYGYNPHRGGTFQMDALMGAVAGVNEMLLQDAGGILRVFPAVPLGRRAAFRNLRAPRGLLVSAQWDGRTATEVSILAEREAQIRLANPWPQQPVRLEKGGEKPERMEGAVLTWTAKKGSTCRLSPFARETQ